MGDAGQNMKIDFTGNCASLQISREIYLRILQKAIAQTQADIVQLEEALPVADYDRVRTIAHRLKGDFGNLRLDDLSALAKDLHDEAVGGKDKEKMFLLIGQFKTFFKQLQQAASGG